MYRTARKRAGNFVIGGVLTAVFLLIPQYTYAFSVCDYLSFALKPFGLCTPTIVVATPTPAPPPTPEPIPPVVPPATPQATTVLSESTTTPTTTVSTTPTPTPDPDWEGYAKRSQALFASIVSYLERDNRRSSSNRDYVTRETFDKQTDRIYEVRSDSVDTLSDAFTTNLLTVTGTGAFSDYVSATSYTATDPTATSTFTKLLASGNMSLNGSLTLATLAGGLLQTDANGIVSTTTIGAASVTDDSLDFIKFVDAFTLDATATFDLDTNGADWNIDDSTFFVDSSTNRIGVGTTTPQNTLDILGTANITVDDQDDRSRGFMVTGTDGDGFVLSNFGNSSNLFAGNVVGQNTTGSLGYFNTIFGLNSGANLVAAPDGHSNSFFGHGAGRDSSQGFGNTFVGQNAGLQKSTGSSNTALGVGAGYTITTGSNNLMLGAAAGTTGGDSITGSNNIVIGNNIRLPDVTASDQLNIGNLIYATSIDGAGTTISSGNVGIGTTSPAQALDVVGNIQTTDELRFTSASPFIRYKTTARMFGIEGGGTRLEINGDGNFDVDFTTDARPASLFVQNTTGNVGMGTSSPQYKLDVNGKLALSGFAALYNAEATDNFTGSFIAGDGGGNLLHTSGMEGYYNTALGISALYNNTTGYQNTALGNLALSENTTGFQNTAVGQGALNLHTTGRHNTAIGMSSLRYTTSGFNNTAVGFNTMFDNATGSQNTVVGYNTGLGIVSGSNNTIIGSLVNGLPPDLSNHIIIADGSGNQRIRIDNNGNVGIGTTSPDARIVLAGLGQNTAELNTESNLGASLVLSDTNTSGAAGSGGSLVFGGTGSQGNLGRFAAIKGLLSNSALNSIGHLAFSVRTNTADATLSEAMRITSDGNVGIGTTTPASKLDISAEGVGNGNTLTFSGLRSQENTLIQPVRDNLLEGWKIKSGGGAQEFFHITDSSNNQRLTVRTDTGNVGIGTTNPGLILEAVGTLGSPVTSGTSQTGTLRVAQSSGGLVMDMGITTTGSNAGWIQPTNRTNLAVVYNLLLNPNGGNVGIGTTNPNQGLLHLHKTVGDLVVYGQSQAVGTNAILNLVSHASGEARIYFGDQDDGDQAGIVYNNIGDANEMQFYTNANQQMVIDSSGNVGIGTSDPGPYKLSVAGGKVKSVLGFSGNMGQSWVLNDNGTGNTFIRSDANNFGIFTSGSERFTVDTSGNVGIGTTTPASKLSIQTTGTTDILNLFETGGSKVFTVLENGNVGIGTSTPGYALDVNGAVRVQNGNIYSGNGGALNLRSDSWVRIYLDADTGGSPDFAIFDETASTLFSVDESTGQTYMSGNVGIGTTTPLYKLDIAGNHSNQFAIGQLNQAGGLWLRRGSDGVATGMLGFSTNDDAGLLVLGSAGGAGQLAFSTNATEKMRIDNSGNVGIGTTSPTHKLTVAGTIGPETDDSYNLGAAGSDWGCLYYNSGTLGTCASDERLKENIETLSFTTNEATALEKVAALKLHTFNFKTAPNSQYAGLIAQEVLDAAPELVTENDDGFLAVRYGDIQWLVLEAVQDLWETVKGFGTRFVSKEIVAEEHLCIGDTCVTEADLKAFLEESGRSGSVGPVDDTEENDEDDENDEVDDTVNETDTNATGTTTSADNTTATSSDETVEDEEETSDVEGEEVEDETGDEEEIEESTDAEDEPQTEETSSDADEAGEVDKSVEETDATEVEDVEDEEEVEEEAGE